MERKYNRRRCVLKNRLPIPRNDVNHSSMRDVGFNNGVSEVVGPERE